MSVIACRECQNQVSGAATFCPKCGCPVQLESIAVESPSQMISAPTIPGGGRQYVVIVVLVIMGLTLWFKPAQHQSLDFQPAWRQPLDKTFTVSAGHITTYRFKADGPGRLSGYWTSSGRSVGIPGAMDDVLASYDLRGPDNRVLARLNNLWSANIDVRCDAAGVYSIEFINSGLFRNSSRKIEFHGAYQPDGR